MLQTVGGVPVYLCAADGPAVRGAADALDLAVNAMYQGAEWIAIPAGRLPGAFFQLRTGLAGEILQKFANYRVGLAVLGDISPHIEASSALRDLVRESNRGRQAWFLPDLVALRERLSHQPAVSPPCRPADRSGS